MLISLSFLCGSFCNFIFNRVASWRKQHFRERFFKSSVSTTAKVGQISHFSLGNFGNFQELYRLFCEQLSFFFASFSFLSVTAGCILKRDMLRKNLTRTFSSICELYCDHSFSSVAYLFPARDFESTCGLKLMHLPGHQFLALLFFSDFVLWWFFLDPFGSRLKHAQIMLPFF